MDKKLKMFISIFGGSGAVSSYFALKLVNEHNRVSIIGRNRSKHLQELIHTGMKIKTSGRTISIPAKSFEYIGEYNSSVLTYKQDLLIISLKQPSLNALLAQQIISLTHNKSVIAIVSNGIPFYFLQGLDLPGKNHIQAIDPEGEIIQLLQNKVVTIAPMLGAVIESLGVTRINTPLEDIKVKIGSTTDNNNAINIINQVFNEANITTIINEHNIHKEILEKLQFALSINVMSALLNKNNGDIFDSEETQPYIHYVIDFVNKLSLNMGIGELRDYNKFKSINITKSHFSSMHKDISDGKMPEINSIISAPLELCEFLEPNKGNDSNIPTLSCRYLKIIQELLLKKSHNISISQEEIDHVLHIKTEDYLMSNSDNNLYISEQSSCLLGEMESNTSVDIA